MIHLQKKLFRFSLIKCSVCFAFILCTNVLLASDVDNARISVHLLDYIEQDYVYAVQDGEIINQEEYAEMQEFGEKIIDITTTLSTNHSDTSFLYLAKQLDTQIAQKTSSSTIALSTQELKRLLLNSFQIETAPSSWPSIENGKALYTVHCTSCHGEQGFGDGPLAASLTPTPTNLLSEKMNSISPFQAFNTIQLGIEETAMTGYSFLSEEEIWDLSFYVLSLRSQGEMITTVDVASLLEEAIQEVSLSELSSLSNEELLDQLSGTDLMKRKKIAALRTGNIEHEKHHYIDQAIRLIDQSVDAYAAHQTEEAKKLALLAYLEGFEPIESSIEYSNKELVYLIEQKLFLLRESIESNTATTEEVTQRADDAKKELLAAKQAIQSEDSSYWKSFFLSGSIIFREGIEAFLLIFSILSVLKREKIKKGKLAVHSGWVVAILSGILIWLMAHQTIQSLSIEREVMEGLITLLAVVMLVYVGQWLHQRSSLTKWNHYIQNKMKTTVRNNSLLGLGILSFFVVFREVIESILFLSAIGLDTSPEHQSSIGLGILAAAFILFIIGYLFIKMTIKMPIQRVIQLSSFIIIILSIILAGKGVHALQEAGWIGIHQSPLPIHIPSLGIYPTIESWVAQIAVVLVTIFFSFMNRKRSSFVDVSPKEKALQ